MKTYGEAARFYLVFYGGSGSTQEEIHEALDYSVVKMNVDTDMQYAFTRAVAGQMFKNDDGVLKVDGEGGNSKADIAQTCWEVRVVPILLQKAFCMELEKFSGL